MAATEGEHRHDPGGTDVKTTNNELRTYLDQVDQLLDAPAPDRRRLLEEVEGHLCDAIDHRVANGMDSTAATRAAIEEFGPPSEVAVGLCDTPEEHRHRLDALAPHRPAVPPHLRRSHRCHLLRDQAARQLDGLVRAPPSAPTSNRPLCSVESRPPAGSGSDTTVAPGPFLQPGSPPLPLSPYSSSDHPIPSRCTACLSPRYPVVGHTRQLGSLPCMLSKCRTPVICEFRLGGR